MFDNLTERLSKIIYNIKSKGKFTEKNIKSIIREIRISLLEADVSLEVVNNFIKQIKDKIIGKEINKSFTPSQDFLKIVKKELIFLIGEKCNPIKLNNFKTDIILIVGLQGVGKTTTIVKLAKFLKNENKEKKILLVSIDIYRPAAIDQLEQLALKTNIDFYSNKNLKPLEIIDFLIKTKKQLYDIILVDTSGRLHINNNMMEEIKKIHFFLQPTETVFVIDAMSGQESANIAKSFNEKIPITSLILTKLDGDMRGGVALSACYITKKPIKFICTGENIEDIKIFYPDRIASQILGMGDVLTLIEDIEKKISIKNSKKISKNIKKGKFDLNDFLEQLQQMRKVGGVKNIISRLPIFFNKFNNFGNTNEKFFLKMEVIIFSMTKKEKLNPQIIKRSHKKRIAKGSGLTIQDINKMLKQFENMKILMKKIKKNGIKKTINNFKSMIPFK